MSGEGGDESRLARWSRRKQAARVGTVEDTATAAPATAPPAVAPSEAAEPELSEDDYLAAHDLAAPETLQEGDDFSAFMQSGVPSALKRRALRRLWRVNPVLANLDELLEYGEDYTDAAMVPEVIHTAYKVGRGFLKDPEEGADEPAGEAASADASPADDAAAGDADAAESPRAQDALDQGSHADAPIAAPTGEPVLNPTGEALAETAIEPPDEPVNVTDTPIRNRAPRMRFSG